MISEMKKVSQEIKDLDKIVEENERVVLAFLAAHPDFTLVPPAVALAAARIELPDHGPADLFFRLRPDAHGTDAFFGALMERT